MGQIKRPPRKRGPLFAKAQRLEPPGQLCSGGRSPILIRSPPVSEPNSGSASGSGIGVQGAAGWAGRATGRVAGAADGAGAAGLAAAALGAGARLEAVAGLDAERLVAGLRAEVLVLERLAAGRRPVLRLAVDFLAPVRRVVERLVLLRLAPPERRAVARLDVDFLVEDFFFAAISIRSSLGRAGGCPDHACSPKTRKRACSLRL